MREKIAILGSTGSVGQTLLKVIDKNKKDYQIVLLTADKNYKLLIKQAIKFKVKNIIIKNKKIYESLKKSKIYKSINILKDFDHIHKILGKKIDYVMSSISGLDGLKPTLKIIKHTKKIAIANKESIICAWPIIKKEIKKYNTQFIPVDSEHFSIWNSLDSNFEIKDVEKIFITASGGPFLNYNKARLKKVKKSVALKHPTWQMGEKITIDSATMMNKVFEVIEAKNIFNIPYKKLSILIHPDSYVHSIVKFNNGLIKITAHDTTMEIPVSSSLKKNIFFNSILNTKKLNNLNLQKINEQKYPTLSILKELPERTSLFETVIVSANDELVKLFLLNKIKFYNISEFLIKFIKRSEFKKFKKIQPLKLETIVKLNKYVRLKINSICI